MNYFAWRFGGSSSPALDESLAEHDKKYHPNGFDPEHETCNKRSELAKTDNGDVLSPNEGDDKGGDKGGDKPLVSSAEDAAYMDAVKRGDMETAAKMVREVAGRAFPNTKVVDAQGTIIPIWKGHFDPSVHVLSDGRYKNSFFSIEKSIADRFNYMQPDDWLHGFYCNMREPVVIDANGYDDRAIPIGIELAKKIGANKVNEEDVSRGDYWQYNLNKPYIEGLNKSDPNHVYVPSEILAQKLHRAILDGEVEGDGIIIRNILEGSGNPRDQRLKATDVLPSHASTQVKSADPVTYDDDGNVIPLSRRFDGGDDIRGDVSGGVHKKVE